MSWLKDAALDFIVLIIIMVLAFMGGDILYVVLWVYSALMLLTKILAQFMPALKQKANKTSAPAYVYHGIYGLIVAILIASGYYYLAAPWAIIWILSFYNRPKVSKKSQAAS
ncbi:hypothetical protein [Gracilimonas mengyeensis]|uniref:Uncharacterized protein n=1 Tax=Gracilimonas mengyeensis TaxID=1302730 RepID=A0A521D5B5_9BACT|nr:hypothetical protein [Gracilimonas mengyeensis]SMO66802.1 hypothetical protein SAMN06265219_107128 [Gracilimonas mengyeensis]